MLDTATMRVIYFTTDVNEPLSLVDKTLLYEYDLTLPEGMQLKNCWNYRLVGNRLINTEAGAARGKVSLVESNRQEAIQLLIERINFTRRPILSTCIGGDIIRELKVTDDSFLLELAKVTGTNVDEYRLYVHDTKNKCIEQLKNSEINREYFLKQLNLATTSEEIIALRDKFVNSDLLQIQTP